MIITPLLSEKGSEKSILPSAYNPGISRKKISSVSDIFFKSMIDSSIPSALNLIDFENNLPLNNSPLKGQTESTHDAVEKNHLTPTNRRPPQTKSASLRHKSIFYFLYLNKLQSMHQ